MNDTENSGIHNDVMLRARLTLILPLLSFSRRTGPCGLWNWYGRRFGLSNSLVRSATARWFLVYWIRAILLFVFLTANFWFNVPFFPINRTVAPFPITSACCKVLTWSGRNHPMKIPCWVDMKIQEPALTRTIVDGFFRRRVTCKVREIYQQQQCNISVMNRQPNTMAQVH